MEDDPPTPKADFFSVFLQQKLSQSLQESLTYMTKTFLIKYAPQQTANRNLAEPISHSLDFLINSAFLALTDANFSEFFYFLQRKGVVTRGKNRRLRAGLKFKLVLLRVLVGYLFPKLRKWAQAEVRRGRFSMDVREQEKERRRVRRIRGVKKFLRVLFLGVDLVNYGFNIKWVGFWYLVFVDFWAIFGFLEFLLEFFVNMKKYTIFLLN